ncbi:hypothetical protein KY312_01100, partial [Candidatus Woesearchaeota archaeon]|nr:hypothetical protein [Candidatus Woesearchaeota archaeon]
MNRKLLIFVLVLFSLLFVQAAYSATTTLAPVLGLNYSVTSGSDPATYGNWSNTIIKDGSPSCSNTTCWGTGIEDVSALTGNEFFQEYHFNISNSGISVSEISSLNFCFSGCWSGGVNGCGHGDEPEFDANNGTAQVQIYNVSGTVWEDVDTPIDLGGWAGSTAMSYTDYCKLKNSIFNDYLDTNILKFRVNISGDYIGIGSDCEMFTDYVALNINVPSTPSGGGGGGGGGGSCFPIWECDDWGTCDLAGNKHRYCYDINKCNIIDGIPELSTKCSPIELCNNGVRDATEEG